MQPSALDRDVQGVLLSDTPTAPVPPAYGLQTSLCTEHKPLILQVLPTMKDQFGCPSSCFLAWRSCSEHTNARENEKGKKEGVKSALIP